MLGKRMHRFVIWAIAFAAGIAVHAAPTTFRIDSVYSNLDGSVQFIRLTETAGLDGQHQIAGLKITSTSHGITRELTIAHDIPTEYTAHVSIAVVAAPIYGAPITVNRNPLARWVPYYTMPERFLSIDGGIIDFAGVDRMEYASLPTDGTQALRIDGTIGPALLPYGKCPSVPCETGAQVTAAPVRAIEYYHRTLDHYFTSASAADLDALDSGRFPGWQRTGFAFSVAASAIALPVNPPRPPVTMHPVCRFYVPPELGDSHFISALRSECDEVGERHPAFVRESDATFHVALPDAATGQCPPPVFFGDETGYSWHPVYRLWNGRIDTNHRYTDALSIRDAMVALGWTAEGHGPDGVAFCAPSAYF